MGDYLKSKYNDTIAVIFSPTEDKVSILAIVGQSLLSKYHAGKIVSAVASRMGGKGGGRADSAMAGGKDRTQIPAIIKDLPEIIAQSAQ
jgi:alanyl-tRNA synthetase